MKITEIPSVQQIEDWTKQRANHCLNDIQVSQFVRDVIPYLKELEWKVRYLEQRMGIDPDSPIPPNALQ